jgi:hypothetical protein
MQLPPVQSPQLKAVHVASALPPSAWRPLSDIVFGIVRTIEAQSLADASASDACALPKAA